MSILPYALAAAMGAAGTAAASPVATFSITDGVIAYAETGGGEALALTGSFRAERAPDFDLDAVNRYVLFAELTASIDGGEAVALRGALPATPPTTLRALVDEAETALRDALAADGAAVGSDEPAEDEGGSVSGAVGGSVLGRGVGGAIDGSLGGANAGGATGAGVVAGPPARNGSEVDSFGRVVPPGAGPAPTAVEEDALDRLLAILTDPDATPRTIGDGLSFGFGFDLTEEGPDVLAGDFEAILTSEEADGVLDPGFDEARFALDLAIDVAPVPLPAGLPLLAAGLGAFGLLARRRS